MRFENSPTGGDGSYEKPKPGKYIGVLNGFAYVGTQPSSLYPAKPAVLLRWELHKRKGPSKDSQGYIHTITNKYGATVRGQNSRLRQALEAHGVAVGEGANTESREWLGKAAWLDLKESDDGKWINVAGVSPLDPDDDGVPEQQLESEHWEPDDNTTPPTWAQWAIGRSIDLAHLVDISARKPAPQPAAATANQDDDEIPF